MYPHVCLYNPVAEGGFGCYTSEAQKTQEIKSFSINLRFMHVNCMLQGSDLSLSLSHLLYTQKKKFYGMPAEFHAEIFNEFIYQILTSHI